MESPILSLSQLNFAHKYTFADYLRWKFTERVELIRGSIHKMCPAPGPAHQSVSLKITVKLSHFFEGTSALVFAAPFDVRLPGIKEDLADEQVDTVVQPDLCVICDAGKIDHRGCAGPPDLVVEVLSPGNSRMEMGEKFRLYEENGVREYWLVDPGKRTVLVYSLRNGRYLGTQFSEEEVTISALFPGLKFKTRDIFDMNLLERFRHVFREPAETYHIPDQIDLLATYTYEEYAKWAFKDRLELIRGQVYTADGIPHPAARRLASRFNRFFKTGEYRGSFSEVCLSAAGGSCEVHSVVRPDFSVSGGPTGAAPPLLLIEVITPESALRDVGVKYRLYKESGIKEYWLVDPVEEVIFIHSLEEGEYVVLPPFTKEVIPVQFPGLRLPVKEVFEDITAS